MIANPFASPAIPSGNRPILLQSCKPLESC